jgi:hypothetical protein
MLGGKILDISDFPYGGGKTIKFNLRVGKNQVCLMGQFLGCHLQNTDLVDLVYELLIVSHESRYFPRGVVPPDIFPILFLWRKSLSLPVLQIFSPSGKGL